MMKIKCIKNKQIRNKNRDACRGGVNSIMGGAENKEKEREEGGARGPVYWACRKWVGFDPQTVGRFGRGIKGC